MGEAAPNLETCACGAPYREDLQIAADARLYTPGLVIRQWRCLNGHPLTQNGYGRERRRAFPFVCDVCHKPGLALAENARRHVECWHEHDRQRKARYALERRRALTQARESSLNGTR